MWSLWFCHRRVGFFAYVETNMKWVASLELGKGKILKEISLKMTNMMTLSLLGNDLQLSESGSDSDD